MSGRLRLRPVMRNDYDILYHLACDPETGRRWRLGGATPIFDVFIRRLSEDVLTQFVVELRGPDVPGGLGAVGLVQAYRPSGHGHAHLASLLRDDLMGRGIAMEAMALFVEHLFRNFGLRYLFAEVPGYNLPFLGAGPKGGRLVFEECGRMPEFEFGGGSYWDLHILGISRASWEAEVRPRIAPVVARRPQRAAPQGRAGGGR